MLKTENPKNGLKAISAFFKSHRITRTRRRQYDYVFEHGQLWIVNGTTGGQWSVVDAEGPGTMNGFDFECVNEPEEE